MINAELILPLPEMKQRYFFEMSYCGTSFFGYQIQPNQISVQEIVEGVLSKLHSNTEVKIIGCGRTDTGVHASHYYFHADINKQTDLAQFIFKMNRMLPKSIAIHDIFAVNPEAHARFDATGRTYRYFIARKKNPFKENLEYHFTKFLNVDAMNKASQYFLGKQDFTSLSKLHTDAKTNICTVEKAHWVEAGDDLYFEIKADRFLRNMVRATVGTLLEVGEGKIPIEEVKTILAKMDRGAAKTSAPADGLYLYKIEYDWNKIKLKV